MTEVLKGEAKILSEKDLLMAWNAATGQQEQGDSAYFTQKLYKDGVSATLDFRPDYLNGHHHLIIEDFSEFKDEEVEGVDDALAKRYADCLDMVVGAINKLKEQGLDFDLEHSEFSTDADAIMADIESRLMSVSEKTALAA